MSAGTPVANAPIINQTPQSQSQPGKQNRRYKVPWVSVKPTDVTARMDADAVHRFLNTTQTMPVTAAMGAVSRSNGFQPPTGVMAAVPAGVIKQAKAMLQGASPEMKGPVGVINKKILQDTSNRVKSKQEERGEEPAQQISQSISESSEPSFVSNVVVANPTFTPTSGVNYINSLGKTASGITNTVKSVGGAVLKPAGSLASVGFPAYGVASPLWSSGNGVGQSAAGYDLMSPNSNYYQNGAATKGQAFRDAVSNESYNLARYNGTKFIGRTALNTGAKALGSMGLQSAGKWTARAATRAAGPIGAALLETPFFLYRGLRGNKSEIENGAWKDTTNAAGNKFQAHMGADGVWHNLEYTDSTTGQAAKKTTNRTIGDMKAEALARYKKDPSTFKSTPEEMANNISVENGHIVKLYANRRIGQSADKVHTTGTGSWTQSLAQAAGNIATLGILNDQIKDWVTFDPNDPTQSEFNPTYSKTKVMSGGVSTTQANKIKAALRSAGGSTDAYEWADGNS